MFEGCCAGRSSQIMRLWYNALSPRVKASSLVHLVANIAFCTMMWRTAALFALAAFAAAKEEDKKIDGPVIGIDLGPWLHSSP